MSIVWRQVVLILCTAVGVTGCQTVSSLTGLGGEAPATPAPMPVPVVVQGEPAAALPVAPVARSAGTLRGLDSAAVMSLWGEPALRRKDIGSELWTYNKGGAACSVLLYLYPSGDGRLLVKRSEAVPGGADDKAVDACAQTNSLPSLKPVS